MRNVMSLAILSDGEVRQTAHRIYAQSRVPDPRVKPRGLNYTQL